MVKNKASGLAEVVDHIRASFDNRMTFLRQNLNETRKTLTDFKEDRKKMSQELTSYLKNYSGDLRKGNAKRIIDFRKFFKELSRENSSVAQELQEYLKKYNIDRLQDFFNFIDPLKEGISDLHKAFTCFQRHTAQVRAKPRLVHTKRSQGFVKKRSIKNTGSK